MATDFEHGGLKWVIDEIYETLKQARVHFESFVEDEEDNSQLQFCTTYLHQVAGSLNMLELSGATLLAEEMELLSQAIYDDAVAQREDSYEVLMRALIQLPDYLERLDRGARDLPMVLLPLLNDLRATRGEKLLTEGAVFSASLDLDNISPEPDNGIDPKLLAAKIRHHYHLGLLGWYRDSNSIASLNKIKKVIFKLKESVKTANFYQLFSLMEAFIEGLMDKNIDSSASTKLLLGQADRYIKQLIDSGEAVDFYSANDEQELQSLKKNLLFYIAHSKSADVPEGSAIHSIKSLYKLADIIPDEHELEDARASLGGANADLMETVTGVILGDLANVKEQLDVFGRNISDAGTESHSLAEGSLRAEGSLLAGGSLLAEGSEHRENLQTITATMTQISDTLAMLGQNAPRGVLQEKIEQLKSMLDSEQIPERAILMDIAGALLYVESAVSEMGHGSLFSHSDDEQSIDLSKINMTEQERHELLFSVIDEAKTELSKTKDSIVSLIDSFANNAQNPEQSTQSIKSINKSLLSISGVLGMLGKEQGAQIVRDCAVFINDSLISDEKLASHDELHNLADTITALEYYLDAIAENQQDLSIIESVAQSGIDQLLGREIDTPVYESELSEALIIWMQDVSIASAKDNLLNVVISVAEQVKLLQNEKAEEIAHQMKSMISLVGDKQASLSDDIASTLRWATETLNRIISSETAASEKKISQTDSLQSINNNELEPAPDADSMTDVEADNLSPSPVEGISSDNNTQLTAEVVNTISPVSNYPDIKKLETSEDVDPEIMEIFIEEAQEEIEKISTLFPQWQAASNNIEVLSEMRRSFHTLKGSGRLVGAFEMGEFSWAFENMLNRIIDETISTDKLHFSTVEAGIELLPEIINAFEQQRLSTVDSSRIAACAHVLSKGESFDPACLNLNDALQVVEDTTESAADIIIDESEQIEDQQQTEEVADAEEGIDPVLLEIFSNEAAGHIKNIEHCIEQCHVLNDICTPDDMLIRSLHTLRGSSHMADIHAIGNVSEQMEKAVKMIVEKGQKLDAEFVQLLEELCRFSFQALEQLNETASPPDENPQLEAKITAKFEQILLLENLLDGAEVDEAVSISEERLAEDIAASQDSETERSEVDTVAHEYDDELLEIFIEEGEELLNSSEQALQQLQKDIRDDQALNRLLRDMHTLKGGARMAGVLAIGDLTHSLENKLEEFTRNEVFFSDAHMALFLQVQNVLAAMIDSLKQGQRVADATDLIAEINSIVEQVSNDSELISEQEIDHDELILEQHISPSEDELSSAQEQQTAAENEATGDIYDDELMEIFLEEAQELMESSDAALSKLRHEPSDQQQLNQLLRDLHTIKGGARMAGIKPIGDLTHSLETQLERVTDQSQTPGRQFFVLLHQAHDTLNDMLDDLKGGRTVRSADELISLAADVLNYADEEPQEEIETSAQLEEHEAEHEEQESVAVQDSADSDDSLLIEDSLSIEDSLPVEDFISVEDSQPVEDSQQVDDSIPVEDSLQPEGSLQAQAEGSSHGGSEAEQEGHTEAAVQGAETEEIIPEVVGTRRVPGNTERVRVSADVLDELVNYAGEVSIYRSRLDQGSNEFQASLEEMNTTILRLREQLRRFEMETEAQIQSRRDQAESLGFERYEEFDPLEFDRFSNMQQITRAMAETVSDLDSLENTMKNLNSESETLLIQQGRVNTDLQEGLMRTRMVPFKSQLTRFRRIIRQTSKELGKQVHFELHGGDHEIDRRVLEKMMAPLEHMLRNAVAHGIEKTDVRIAQGKPAAGKIKLLIARDGSEIDIRVADDGAGVDIEAVRRKAVEHGLIKEHAQLSEQDIIHFIMESGFSTATEVSQIAGRGVGMDVVNAEIKQLNGMLEINSEQGKGSVFKVLMPLTMSVSRALMVEVGEEIFAIPLVGIENIIRESHDVLQRLTAGNDTYYQWHDEQYQFMHLGTVLGINSPSLPGEKSKAPILLARSGEHRVALFVDGLMGSREIVVKSVGPQLSTVKGVTGATILGDGKISLILDLGVLAREGAMMKMASEQDVQVRETEKVAHTIMVVDDSITVRKVTQRLLQRYDYQVITAKDGVDAIATLHETIPDVMLLDVEMPRMDGFELATHMRDDEQFKDIPIIMITSRTGDKHRDRAMKIGVDEYMGKPYQEHDLISNIKKLTQD